MTKAFLFLALAVALHAESFSHSGHVTCGFGTEYAVVSHCVDVVIGSIPEPSPVQLYLAVDEGGVQCYITEQGRAIYLKGGRQGCLAKVIQYRDLYRADARMGLAFDEVLRIVENLIFGRRI